MAQLGTALIELYLVDSPWLVNPLPSGGLIEPFVLATPELIVAQYTNRFPTPPIAWGFLIDFADIDDAPAFDRLLAKAYGDIASALSIEGAYLEPTIGQIWPR